MIRRFLAITRSNPATTPSASDNAAAMATYQALGMEATAYRLLHGEGDLPRAERGARRPDRLPVPAAAWCWSAPTRPRCAWE